jgi:DNA replication protein DnaC
MTKANCNKLWYNSISAGTFIEDYMKNTRIKESNFDLKNYYTGKLYIDDLGFENKTYNKSELFAEILFERNRRDVKTHVTTNLNPAELVDRYGARIGDRLPQMFNIISWNGESFRE